MSRVQMIACQFDVLDKVEDDVLYFAILMPVGCHS